MPRKRAPDSISLPTEDHQSPITRSAKGKEKDAISASALDKVHTLIPNEGWKVQEKLWAEADDELRKSYLYGLVLNDGVTDTSSGRKRLAAFFAVKPKDLEPYKSVMAMADAARVLKINRNQLAMSLLREDQPTLKFHMGKQFAYQVNDPVHEGVENADAPKNELTIKVIGNEPAPTSIESAGDSAIDGLSALGLTLISKDRAPN
jgi:hypothetical protein